MRSERMQRFARNGRRHLRQRQMRGDERDAQFGRGQHHHHVAVRALRKKFSVAAEGFARVVDRRFLHRRGDQRIELAGHAAIRRARQRVQHVEGVARIRLAGNFSGAQRRFDHAQGSRRAQHARRAVEHLNVQRDTAAPRRTLQQRGV